MEKIKWISKFGFKLETGPDVWINLNKSLQDRKILSNLKIGDEIEFKLDEAGKVCWIKGVAEVKEPSTEIDIKGLANELHAINNKLNDILAILAKEPKITQG